MASRIEKSEMIADMQRVALEIGKSQLPKRDYEELGTISTNTICSQFGSWNNAIIAAGITPKQKLISDDELLMEIIKVTSEIEKIPSAHEMDAYGCFNTTTYRKRWGTFTAAREVAYRKYGQPIDKILPRQNSKSSKSSLTEIKNISNAVENLKLDLLMRQQSLIKNIENNISTDEKQTYDSNSILAINFQSQLVEAAKESSGQNNKFCFVVAKLPLDQSFPIDLAKELERELRKVLNSNDRGDTLGLLIRKAKDSNALTERGIDLAHVIRKQRNFVAHEPTTDLEVLQAQIYLCLFSAALLWREFS